MNNFIQPGTTLSLPMPYDRVSGEGVLVANIFGVVCATALSGATAEVAREGVFTLARATGASSGFAIGTKLYWDNTNKVVTKTSTSNTLIGAAAAAAADGDATAKVLLDGAIR